jgi:hypothetical protein
VKKVIVAYFFSFNFYFKKETIKRKKEKKSVYKIPSGVFQDRVGGEKRFPKVF